MKHFLNTQDWSRADRTVAGLMIACALGFIAGAVTALWG